MGNARNLGKWLVVAAMVLALLGSAAPAWADVVQTENPVIKRCGLLGGATASLMLAAGGCWAVWACRRPR